jgi:hypothetical protein
MVHVLWTFAFKKKLQRRFVFKHKCKLAMDSSARS